MIRSILVGSLFFGASLLFAACGDSSSGGGCPDGQVDCSGACIDETDASLDWVQDNVFSANGCATAGSCHDGSNLNTLEDLDLRTAPGSFESLVNVESSQAPPSILVVPGESESSYLVNKLLGTGLAPGTDLMPLGATQPLCNAKIEGVRAWIDAGANP